MSEPRLQVSMSESHYVQTIHKMLTRSRQKNIMENRQQWWIRRVVQHWFTRGAGSTCDHTVVQRYMPSSVARKCPDHDSVLYTFQW